MLAYLQGTTDLAIRYQSQPTAGLELLSLGFEGFLDASFADDLTDRKSASDYLFKFARGVISWKSRKQPILTTSSTESEYVAYSLACKETIWLRGLFLEVYPDSANVQTVLLYGDNQPAIALTLNLAHHGTKYIQVQWHFIREQVKHGTMILKYIPTASMRADGLTKPLIGLQFQQIICPDVRISSFSDIYCRCYSLDLIHRKYVCSGQL